MIADIIIKKPYYIKTEYTYTDEIRSLRENSVESIKSYVSKQLWSEEYKKSMMDDTFLRSLSPYYLHYPMLFNKAFGIEDPKILQDLNIAGFLYFIASNEHDDLIDAGDLTGVYQKVQHAGICRENAIKILVKLFPDDSEFWKLMQARKEKFDLGYKMNKKSSNRINSLDDYNTYANCKAAFAYLAIDALYALSKLENRNEIYQQVLETYSHFSIALQVEDDLKDFSEDVKSGQFNLLNFYVSDEQLATASSDDIKYELYENGTMSECINYGLLECEKVLESPLNLYYFKFTAQGLFNGLLKENVIISSFIKRHKAKQNLKNTATSPLNATSNPIALASAQQFITENQHADGLWEDCLSSNGLGDTFASAFILAFLPELPEHFLGNSIQKLLSLNQSSTGWGFNSSWIPDADTSTQVLLACLNSKTPIDQNTFKSWLTYQNEDGGFAKYNDLEALKVSINLPSVNFSGWLQSHLCVSAAAFYFLSKFDQQHPAFKALKTYIIKELASECEPYWYTEPLYVIYYLLKGAKVTNDQHIYEQCISLLKSKYLDNGLPKAVVDNNFYLALLTEVLLDSPELKKDYQEFITFAYNLLLSRQFNDGSFASSSFMRDPAPFIIEASAKHIRWSTSPKRGNLVFEDYNRLLTTAACLKTISKCRDFSIYEMDAVQLQRQEKIFLRNNIRPEINLKSTSALSDALRFVVENWQTGYKELTHKMNFGGVQHITSEEDQEGDIFQRAVIASLLKTTVNNVNSFDLNAMIEYEANYLEAMKDSSSGWRYFPDFLELVCDADDLAQIMQVHSGKDTQAFERLFREPLEALFKESENGIFKSWIYSKNYKGLEKLYAETCWGDTHDVDVVSNVGYAIHINLNKLDFIADSQLQQILDANASFVANCQNKKGYWESIWYDDIYYGTYVALRFLSYHKRYAKTVEKTIGFLVSTQNTDGSWGAADQERLLSTSLALLSFYETGRHLTHQTAILKARQFLTANQQNDGSFRSDNFIKMDLGRPSGVITETLYYKSDIICTAYCAAALSYG